MDDLVAFLRARIDEDEAAAKALQFACRIPGKMPDFTAAGGPAAEAYWQHYGPARAVREVAAKRAILETHVPAGDPADYDYAGPPCTECECLWPCLTLRALAAVYNDHPDYRPEWKP